MNTAEFAFLGKNLAKGGGIRSGAASAFGTPTANFVRWRNAPAFGLKKLRAGKRMTKNMGTKMLGDKGAIGKVSRYGYKKAQQGINLGRNLGRSAMSTGQNLLNKLRNKNKM